MPQYLKPAIILGAAGAAMLLLTFLTPGSLFVPGMICSVLAAILLLMTAGTAIASRKNKQLSGWKLFALCDLVLMLIVGVIGAIDLITAKDSPDFGPGLLGAILFYYGLPALGGVLIIEFILWRMSKMFTEETDTPEQHHHHGENCTCEECTHKGREEQ